MKILSTILIFTTFFLSFSLNYATNKNKTVVDNDFKIIESVIFDGKEGNLYFFTDPNLESITIEDNKNILIKSFDFDPNSLVGSNFRLILKVDVKDKYVYDAVSVVNIELTE